MPTNECIKQVGVLIHFMKLSFGADDLVLQVLDFRVDLGVQSLLAAMTIRENLLKRLEDLIGEIAVLV